jgi:hypothetical protein
MKVLALLTASLMAAGGATYFFASSSDGGCPFSRCPVATSGGCCSAEKASAKHSCCELACPACETDCAECCSVCETCCVAGAGTASLNTSVVKAKAKSDCCAAGGSDCCAPGAACCAAGVDCCVTGTCCDGAKANAPAFKDAGKYTLAKPAAGCASCCDAGDSPVSVATAAALAGAGAK